MYVCTICAFFRLCNYPCQIMRLSIAHISHNAKSWPILAHILQGQILRWRTKIDKYEVWRLPFGLELFLLVNCGYCKERKITKLSSLLSVPTTGHSWRPVISCRWGYKLIFQWNDVSCSDIA